MSWNRDEPLPADFAPTCRTCSDTGTVYARRGLDDYDAEDCPDCPEPDHVLELEPHPRLPLFRPHCSCGWRTAGYASATNIDRWFTNHLADVTP